MNLCHYYWHFEFELYICYNCFIFLNDRSTTCTNVWPFCEQFDQRIRDKVEKTLIEPYKGLTDDTAASVASNVLMYKVSS